MLMHYAAEWVLCLHKTALDSRLSSSPGAHKTVRDVVLAFTIGR